jgi:hypothetical protein
VQSNDTRGFLESLLDDAGVEVHGPYREEMIEGLFVLFNRLVTAAVERAMSPRDREEFIRMREQGYPSDEIDAFVARSVPDLRTVLDDATAHFRWVYLLPFGRQ